jgi:hypothetical protein
MTEGAEFCTIYIGYTAPVATVTQVSTAWTTTTQMSTVSTTDATVTITQYVTKL